MAKNKIPKTIFGVKIPKALRKSSLIKGFLNTPAGRQIVADALVAAASAASAALVATKSDKVAKSGKSVVEAGENSSDVVKKALKSAATALTDNLSNAARSALGVDDSAKKPQRGARPH